MQAEDATQLIADRERRVECVDRVLKDQADLATTDVPQLVLAELAQVAVAKDHFTRNNATRVG